MSDLSEVMQARVAVRRFSNELIVSRSHSFATIRGVLAVHILRRLGLVSPARE